MESKKEGQKVPSSPPPQIAHSKTESYLDNTAKPKPRGRNMLSARADAANEFPRAASQALCEDQTSDGDDDVEMDFSVEREILKRQLAKKKQEREDKATAANEQDGKPDHLKHQYSSASVLDQCEEDDDEDMIVKALEDIDRTSSTVASEDAKKQD